MDDVVETIGEVAEPVVETLKEWSGDAIDTIKKQSPHCLKFLGYALIKKLHL